VIGGLAAAGADVLRITCGQARFARGR
jgi:hypothetical protein